MSEAPRETPQVYPFQKFPAANDPDPESDSKVVHPFRKLENPSVPKPADTAPKEEGSARASAPSSTSTTVIEQTESETTVQTPVGKENGTDSEQIEQAKTDNQDLDSSTPPSSSETSPGWTAPPVQVTPPTNE